jgi:hypothetical protein
LPPRYRCPLDRLPASRLLLPRSGLERSDFVPWPYSDLRRCPLSRCCWGIADIKRALRRTGLRIRTVATDKLFDAVLGAAGEVAHQRSPRRPSISLASQNKRMQRHRCHGAWPSNTTHALRLSRIGTQWRYPQAMMDSALIGGAVVGR